MLLYIDPGSGTLLFQALLSGLLTFLFFFKKILFSIKRFFAKNKNEKFNEVDDL